MVRLRPVVAFAGTAPVADEIARFIELENRRRRRAAFRLHHARLPLGTGRIRARRNSPWLRARPAGERSRYGRWNPPPTPITLPSSQWLGSGFGHIGSTSNRGAITAAAFTFATLSSTTEAVPSARKSATKMRTQTTIRFILLSPPPSEVSYSSRVEAIIHDSKSSNQFFRALVALFFALWPFGAAAHDIPNDVTAQLFIKPAGQQLERAGSRAVEIDARRRFSRSAGPGYLDLDRTAPLLPDAATLWISDFIELYEDDDALAEKAARGGGARVAGIRPVVRLL